MCGIAGFFDPRGTRSLVDYEGAVTKMTHALIHRGPDDGGSWVDPASGVALGHRRLSIIDLSPSGQQPMCSASNRYWISFNGEIYNFRDLAVELEILGYQFRGHSDTEVLLAAIETWGIDTALQRVIGMFAFALWDRDQKTLHLARDRVGEKPLYYGWVANRFLFASELKALCIAPDWNGDISREALDRLMRYGYIPAPYTIYNKIYKLVPGCVLSLPVATLSATTPYDPVPDSPAHGVFSPRRYWSPLDVATRGLQQPLATSDTETIGDFERLFRAVVRQQMVADVPIGAFLSGGIDSTLVVACMQAESKRPVTTFTVGYHEEAFNEAKHAKSVARHLGTDHHEVYVTPDHAFEIIPRLPELYDEPFADSSQIPALLVSQLARRHVTVSLSGDGGDELFAGYNRYFWPTSISRRTGWLPASIRALLSSSITRWSPKAWNDFTERTLNFFPALRRHIPAEIGNKLHKLAMALHAPSPMGIYRSLISYWDGPSIVLGYQDANFARSDGELSEGADFIDQAMFFDFVRYLPDDNLVKVDRASMSVGLEIRVPLLDPRIVEYAWSLPRSMKLRDGKGKWILREVLAKYVPRELTERPKMGFSVPVGQWLIGPLRDWAEDLLDESRLRCDGFFDVARVRQRWNEHLSGTRDWSLSLWAMLMFQAWYREQPYMRSERTLAGEDAPSRTVS